MQIGSCRRRGQALKFFQTRSSSRACSTTSPTGQVRWCKNKCQAQARAREVATHIARFRIDDWCFCGPGSEKDLDMQCTTTTSPVCSFTMQPNAHCGQVACSLRRQAHGSDPSHGCAQFARTWSAIVSQGGELVTPTHAHAPRNHCRPRPARGSGSVHRETDCIHHESTPPPPPDRLWPGQPDSAGLGFGRPIAFQSPAVHGQETSKPRELRYSGEIRMSQRWSRGFARVFKISAEFPRSRRRLFMGVSHAES